MDLNDLLFSLKFHRDYDRERQMARLTAHLKENNNISQFFTQNQGNEQTIDNLIRLVNHAHDALKEATATPPKKPWQFWK